jgi:phosphopantetheinyl transferase (holo-ACP synthase)
LSLARAVVWTDHQHATVIRFDADGSTTQHLRAHVHPTAQHASAVRAEHEFFAEVCAALEASARALVTGGHTALADFKHYVTKHRPQLQGRIAGYEVVDHPSERQLLAQARSFFDRLERLAPAADKTA